MPLCQSDSIQQHKPGALEELLHALNQPLTQIRCTVELMLYRSTVLEDRRETLATVLRQAEWASKLSRAMQQVIEIEREHREQPQRTNLAAGIENALSDFMPVAEHNGIQIIRGTFAECEIAVSARALGTALFLMLDQLSVWAKNEDAIEVATVSDSNRVELLCRLVASTEASVVVSDEAHLALIKSVCGAFRAELNLKKLRKAVELRLSIPRATEV